MKRIGQKGFSLVEVVVVVAIIVILLLSATENFFVASSNSTLKNDSTDIKGILRVARMTAISTGQPVAVQFRSVGPTSEWRAFIDDGTAGGNARNGELDGCEMVLWESGTRVSLCDNPDLTEAGTFRSLRRGIALQVPLTIVFASSGRRLRPPAVDGIVQVTLQNPFGKASNINITPTGEVL